MKKTNPRELKRRAKHTRIRKKVCGTQERPRLCVHKSLKNFSAQLVDDVSGKVLFGLTTLNKDVRSKLKHGGNVEAAAALGKEMAQKAKGQGVTKVAFDRGGYLFHGRIKAFAEAAREGGLEF